MINLYNFMDGIDGLAGNWKLYRLPCYRHFKFFGADITMVFAINLVLSLTLVSFLKLNWAPAKNIHGRFRSLLFRSLFL